MLKSIYLKLAGILNKLPFNNSFKLRGTKLTYKGARLLKCKFDCNGKNNKIIIEKDALLRRCVFKIDGNNNTVHIGKNTIVNDTEFYLSDNNNNITLGDKTWICGKTNLNCLEGTTIKTGEECLFSSEIVLRTSDSHSIMNSQNVRINKGADIELGDHVWIGYHVMITKGVHIKDGSIVGTGSVVTKSFDKPNVVIVGVPAKVVKEDVTWSGERR